MLLWFLWQCGSSHCQAWVGTMSAKLGLADAFKHILVRSQDWPLLGSSWDLQWLDGSTDCLYFMDLFLPLVCAAPQLCSMNMLMPFSMPCKSTKCRTCYTNWMITSLLVHWTPQFVPASSWPWLQCVRSLVLPSIPKKSQNLLQP